MITIPSRYNACSSIAYHFVHFVGFRQSDIAVYKSPLRRLAPVLVGKVHHKLLIGLDESRCEGALSFLVNITETFERLTQTAIAITRTTSESDSLAGIPAV